MKKENRMIYQIKAAHLHNKRINRLLQICGGDTLDDLSDAILDAFGFDHDHLYLFNMENQRFGTSSYQSMAQSTENSTNICLDQLNLSDTQKFLYLYDFGQEWMFELTVQKVMEDEEYRPPVVLKEIGELMQYPEYNDQIMNDEEAEQREDGPQIRILDNLTIEEILEELEDSYIEDQYAMLFYPSSTEELPIPRKREEIAKEVLANPEHLCEFLPNTLLEYLMDLTSGEEGDIAFQVRELMKLYSFGFLRCTEEEGQAAIEIPARIQMVYASYFRVPANLKNIRRQMELEHIAQYLACRYGLIELEAFYPILNYSANRKLTYEEFQVFVNIHLHYWGNFYYLEEKNGTILLTILEEEAREIQRKRKETDALKGLTYPVFTYKHCKKAALEGYWQEYEAFLTIQKHLESQSRFTEDGMYAVLNPLVYAVMADQPAEAAEDIFRSVFHEFGCNFTKRIQKMIGECYRGLPRAVLKGFTQSELGKTGCIREGMYDSLETARKVMITARKIQAKENKKSEEYDQLSLF